MAAQVKRLLINNHENRMEKKNPKDAIWTESNTKIGKIKAEDRKNDEKELGNNNS
jgi:hypothetical protein